MHAASRISQRRDMRRERVSRTNGDAAALDGVTQDDAPSLRLGLALGVDRGSCLLNLPLDEGVVDVAVAVKARKKAARLVCATLGEEETRRLGLASTASARSQQQQPVAEHTMNWMAMMM